MNERKDAKTLRNAEKSEEAVKTKRRHAERSEASRTGAHPREIIRCAQDDGLRSSTVYFSRLASLDFLRVFAPLRSFRSPPVPIGYRKGLGLVPVLAGIPPCLASRHVPLCPAMSSSVQL